MLFFLSGFSQTTGEGNDLLRSAGGHLFTDPDQSIRIAEQIINTSQSDEIALHAHLILSKGYFLKGEYKESIEHFFELKKISIKRASQEMQLDINFHGITLFNTLGLYEMSEKLDSEIRTLLRNSSNLNNKTKYELFSRTKMADSLLKNGNFQRVIAVFEQTDAAFLGEHIHNTSPAKLMGDAYLGIKEPDLAREYYENALQQLRSDIGFDYQEIQLLIAYSTTFFMESNYQKAIDTLNKAITLNKLIQNDYYHERAFEQLARNHLALENEASFREFISRTNMASNEVATNVNNAINTVFNLLQTQNQENKTLLTKKLTQTQWFAALGFIVLISIGFLTHWFIRTDLRHAQDTVHYMKLIKEFDNKESLEIYKTKEFVKSLHIPLETERAILVKLEKFEKGNKFTSNEMSLAQMASQFETNTKYLSEIINKHKGKNFNMYINELRIKYIVMKLKTESNYLQYKVSYLAEESGFSSHSSFATVFKNITGISPNVFIGLLKKDMQSKKSKVYDS